MVRLLTVINHLVTITTKSRLAQWKHVGPLAQGLMVRNFRLDYRFNMFSKCQAALKTRKKNNRIAMFGFCKVAVVTVQPLELWLI